MVFLKFCDLRTKGVGYSKAHLWRLIRAGKFPAPVKGLGQQNVWPESEIDAVVAERVAEREAAGTEAA